MAVPLSVAAAAARFAPPSRRQCCCSAEAVLSPRIMCQVRSNTFHVNAQHCQAAPNCRVVCEIFGTGQRWPGGRTACCRCRLLCTPQAQAMSFALHRLTSFSVMGVQQMDPSHALQRM